MSVKTSGAILSAVLLTQTFAWAIDISSGPIPAPPAAPKPVSPAARLLPAPIIDALNREYPGWTLARVSKAVQDQFTKHTAGHPPCVIGGDFDGDGQKDYGVQIARTQPDEEEQIVIAFLRRGDVFEEVILESRGLDPNIYLWSRQQRRSDAEAYPPAQQMQRLIVVMGGQAGDSSYAYENGTFHEVAPPVASQPPPYDGAESP